jgi:hypothetical protein
LSTVAVSVTPVLRTTGPAGVTTRLVWVVPGGGSFTTKLTEFESEPVKLAVLVGVNVAVTAWAPSANVDVLTCATPNATVPVPIECVSAKNSTVPTALLGMIVAVRVTAVPSSDGLAGEVESTVEVTCGLTTNGSRWRSEIRRSQRELWEGISPSAIVLSEKDGHQAGSCAGSVS